MYRSWICNDCGSEFLSECSTACLQCGSLDVSPVEGGSPEILPDVKSNRVIKDILLELCQETYEKSFKSVEWDTLIDQTIQKLKPFLKEVRKTVEDIDIKKIPFDALVKIYRTLIKEGKFEQAEQFERDVYKEFAEMEKMIKEAKALIKELTRKGR